MRWHREPALHFVAIGALLFVARGGFGGSSFGIERLSSDADTVIAIGTEQVDALRREWLARTGRPPDAETLDALIGVSVDEELLFREARAMNLHMLDPLVRRRLIQNMRFVDDDPSRSDDELFDEAVALGMDRSDLVVRRRLVQMMQLRAQSLARRAMPSREELEEHLRQNREHYKRSARVKIAHVYLSRDRRGGELDSDAAAILAELDATGVRPERASDFGDPFLFPHQLPPRSKRELAKTFGPDFADAVISLDVDPPRWRGPFTSAYGRHLVWVYERTPARHPDLFEVDREVQEAVFEERGREELRRFVVELRARYTVRRPGSSGKAEQAG